VSVADEKAVRCLVEGRVQGVYFRAATAQEAKRLRLRGWARNLPEGHVEVVVAGPADAVAALSGWLWRGPPAARVASVEVEEWNGEVGQGFAVL
jgi:acylphosphatase